MLKQLMILEVNSDTNIEFLVNDEQMFYGDASMQIRYNKNSDSYIVLNGMVCDGIIALKNGLTMALKNEMQLPQELEEKGVGYWFNLDCTKLTPAALPYNLLNYSLWSTVSEIGNSTWLYNVQDKIILEVSPTYKWLFGDHENVSGYYPFEEFMKAYEIVDRQIISRELAEKWLQQCSGFTDWESPIFDLENELLKPEVRSSADKIKLLLSEDFFEFGSSGKIYHYIPGITFEDEPGTSYEIESFLPHMLSKDYVLAVYKLKKKKPDGSEEYSLRSSVWKRCGGTWKIVFHQGTPAV